MTWYFKWRIILKYLRVIVKNNGWVGIILSTITHVSTIYNINSSKIESIIVMLYM